VLNSGAWRSALSRQTLLVLPALILMVGVFIYPVGRLLLRSLSEPVWGLQNFRELMVQPVYFSALVNTVVISGSVTLICLLAGYPLAYTIARASGRAQRLLIFAVLIPFWSSILVRTFAWLVSYRLLTRDYEYRTDVSETMIVVAMIHLMARRTLTD